MLRARARAPLIPRTEWPGQGRPPFTRTQLDPMMERILAICVPPTIPGYSGPTVIASFLLTLASRMMMWVRSATAGTGAWGVRGSGTMTTPDPESPGVLGPYHRNAVPLANSPAAVRQVPPFPTTNRDVQIDSTTPSLQRAVGEAYLRASHAV